MSERQVARSTDVIACRLPAGEAALIRRAARVRGISVSALIRDAVVTSVEGATTN